MQQSYWISWWMRCAMFQVNAYLLVIYQNINIFTQEALYSPFISEKIVAFNRKLFSKYPFFTTFSLFQLWFRFLIFEISTDLLINQLKNIIAQGTIHPSFILKKQKINKKQKAKNTKKMRPTWHIHFFQ